MKVKNLQKDKNQTDSRLLCTKHTTVQRNGVFRVAIVFKKRCFIFYIFKLRLDILKYMAKDKYSQVCINTETMVTRGSFVKKKKRTFPKQRVSKKYFFKELTANSDLLNCKRHY